MNTFTCQDCGISFEAVRRSREFCDVCKLGRNRRHGRTETVEWKTWARIRRRCNSPTYHNYPRYGARGIKVCERWDDFANFLADMGPRPEGMTLDRIDNDGNYEPGNCRWATQKQQNMNRGAYNYTAEEDQKIRDAVARGLNFTEMAALMGMTRGAVMGRTYRLGLRSGQPFDNPTLAHPSQERKSP